jgi:UDP-glucuronate 4-epimerase
MSERFENGRRADVEKILVTGGAGFIGSHLCEYLLDNKKNVLCLDNFDNYYDPSIKWGNIANCLRNRNFSIIEEDIRDFSRLNRLKNLGEVDQIVHLAGRGGVIPSVQNPQATFENNVIGTQNILDICRLHDIRKITLASSSSVYGKRSTGPFKEADDVLKPASPYAASKMMNEIMAHAYCATYGIDATCLRLFTVYGPRQRPDMAISHFVKQVLTQNKLSVYGNPNSSRDYTYISDIIEGIHGCMDLKGGYYVLNLGNSHPVKLGQLVEIILSVTEANIEVRWLPERIGDVPMTWADCTQAQELIGFKPSTTINEGVEKFVRWYRQK